MAASLQHDRAARTRVGDAVARSVYQRTAGLLLSLAGVGILMGSITAEALYPGIYSTHADSLSHLGATEPPNSIVLQPSASIFDVTMLATGAMVLVSAWLLYRARHSKAVSIPIGMMGLGILGVGIFPLTSPTPHTLFAMAAFFSGGVAAILASRITPRPFRIIWMALGVVALVAITLAFILIHWGPVAALGEGGIERWNCFPIVLWMVAFGTFLLTAPVVEVGADPGQ